MQPTKGDNMSQQSYNVNDVVLSINGQIIEGYSNLEFIKITSGMETPVPVSRDLHGHSLEGYLGSTKDEAK